MTAFSRSLSASQWPTIAPSLRKLANVGGVAGFAALLGLVTALGYGKLLGVAVIVLGAAWVARKHLAYVVPAVLLLLTLNGVPGIDMERYVVPGSFRPEDIFALSIIGFAACRMLLMPQRPLPSLQRYLWIWSPAFLVVWLIAMVHGMNAGASWLKASLFGRDFLYLALLAPLAGYLFVEDIHRRRFAVIVGAWTAIFSVFFTLAQLKVINAAIVNPHATATVGSILRIYSPMVGLVVLTFLLAFAYVLLGKDPGRRWALLILVPTGLVCVLSLTRALYVGLIAGITLGTVVWALRGGIESRRFRKRVVAALGIVAATGIGIASLVPSISNSDPVNAVSSRAESGLTAFTSRPSRTVSTLSGRKYVAEELLTYLGDSWPLGVGFVPPSTRYLVGVPNGSIRDPDLGILNGIMTMGALGTMLLYAPFLLMLTMLFNRRNVSDVAQIFSLGVFCWLIVLMASSLTLVLLFDTPGLVLDALVLGFVAHVIRDGAGASAESRHEP